MKKIHVFLLILIACVTTAPASPVFAQAYRSQVEFLEKFAASQYDRGDMESAMKHFGWILRIDPNNATARSYLKKLESASGQTSTPAPERINQIITDISSVKNNLAGYEKDARELTRLIRDLITENDALYQALYKRSREVAEMRQKFYGTPYEEAYAEAMSSIPLDRVPQRLHASNEILPEDSVTLGEPEGPLLLAGKMPPGSSSAQEQLNAALQAKRDILVEKTATMAEKRDSLDKLKNELAGINSTLKYSNNRYLEAINRIDAYYLRIKENLAKKNYVEQKMFGELVTDYANKLKEIEELKNSVRTQDNSLTSFKPAIAAANDRLRDIDEGLKAKDDTILKYQEIILRQQNELSIAEKELSGISGQVTAIEKDLQNSGDLISRLKTSIARNKGKSPVELQSLERSAEHIKDLKNELAELGRSLSKPLTVNDPEKETLGRENSRLNTELEQARQNLAASATSVKDIAAREKDLLEKVKLLLNDNAALKQASAKTKHERIAAPSEDTAAIKPAKNTPVVPQNEQVRRPSSDQKAIQDLEKRLRANYEKLTASETRLTIATSEIKELRKQLAAREIRVETAKASSSDKNDAEKKELISALVSKDQELVAVKGQLAELQQNYDLMVQDAKTDKNTRASAPVVTTPKPAAKNSTNDDQIKALHQDLDNANDAAKTAEARLKAAEEEYAALEIRQEAIDKIMDDRETRIAALMTEVQALKDELAVTNANHKEQWAKVDAATAARILAEEELKTNAHAVSGLQRTIKDLIDDMKSAKALVEKKSRDHDATLKELRRLSDILDQKRKELNALLLRMDSAVKEPPVPAQE
jgi:chromosome segregation ATPase